MQPKKLTAGTFFSSVGRALCYLFLFVLCQAAVTGLYALTISLYTMLTPGAALDATKLLLACSDQISLISGLAALIMLAAFFLLRRKNPLKESGFRTTHGRFVFTALAVTPLLYASISFCLGLLPLSWTEGYTETVSSLNQTGILATVSTVLIAPLVEEIIFRGLVLTRLARVIPGWLAVLLSALLFASVHGQPVWMAYAFILGVVFGFLALRAKSVWPSLCAHILFNSIGQFTLHLPADGNAGHICFLALLISGAVFCLAVFLFRAFRPLNRKNVG